MTKCKYFIFFFCAAFTFCAAADARADRVVLEYFYQSGCQECEKVTAFVLPQLSDKYTDRYELRKYETSDKDSFLRLAAYQEKLKIDAGRSVCIVVNGRVALAGYETIRVRLFTEIDQCLVSDGLPPEPIVVVDRAKLQQRGERFTIVAVLIAGVVDGINPCVFSTLIFFLTLLATAKVNKTKLLLIGSVYCFSCFLTYLLLGFGVLRFLQFFSGNVAFHRLLTASLLLVLLLFMMLSFVDAWRYWRTGQAGSVVLQLPSRIRLLIHQIMRQGGRYHFIMPGVFVIGMLVTVLESVCTGQVYVPTLVLLARETTIFSKWFGYLLLYNLMFILPLIGLFLAVYFGISSARLLRWGKREVIIGKLLMGLLFICLAVLLFVV